MSGGSAAYGGAGPAGDVYFNYTPLVDVTFNLILYFVLTSTINTQVMARVIVPTVHDSAAVATEKLGTDRVVVNVVSAEVFKRWPRGPQDSRGRSGLLFEATATFADGTSRTLASDSTWRAIRSTAATIMTKSPSA